MHWESTQWKQDLREFLGAYFSESYNEESVKELVSVTSQDEGRHNKFVAAISEGIDAAKNKDTDVIQILEDVNLFGTNSTLSEADFMEAENMLTEISKEYMQEYLA
jgi:hypothetical protein